MICVKMLDNNSFCIQLSNTLFSTGAVKYVMLVVLQSLKQWNYSSHIFYICTQSQSVWKHSVCENPWTSKGMAWNKNELFQSKLY